MERDRTTRRVGVALVAALAVAALTACAPLVSPRATVLPTRESTVAPSPTAPSATASSTPGVAPTSAAQDCGGVAVSLSGTGSRTVLTGDCPTVTIAGAGIQVDLTQARAGVVTINGDRNRVDAARLTTLTIGGQGNQADVAELGALTINGDRNEVGATGALGAVTVSGNDNRVVAASLGAVNDSGQRNAVTTR